MSGQAGILEIGNILGKLEGELRYLHRDTNYLKRKLDEIRVIYEGLSEQTKKEIRDDYNSRIRKLYRKLPGAQQSLLQDKLIACLDI